MCNGAKTGILYDLLKICSLKRVSLPFKTFRIFKCLAENFLKNQHPVIPSALLLLASRLNNVANKGFGYDDLKNPRQVWFMYRRCCSSQNCDVVKIINVFTRLNGKTSIALYLAVAILISIRQIWAKHLIKHSVLRILYDQAMAAHSNVFIPRSLPAILSVNIIINFINISACPSNPLPPFFTINMRTK